MEIQSDNSRDVVSFEVEWLRELNEVAVHVRHFVPGVGQVIEETCLLIPKALAIELRYALDRALKSASAA